VRLGGGDGGVFIDRGHEDGFGGLVGGRGCGRGFLLRGDEADGGGDDVPGGVGGAGEDAFLRGGWGLGDGGGSRGGKVWGGPRVMGARGEERGDEEQECQTRRLEHAGTITCRVEVFQ
jgi:hypothetical protein